MACFLTQIDAGRLYKSSLEEQYLDLSTYVSVGGSLRKVQDVDVFSDFQYVYFIIPDIPRPVRPSIPTCPRVKPLEKGESLGCEMLQDNAKMNMQTYEMLQILNNALTTAAIDAAELEPVAVDETLYILEEPVEPMEAPPTPRMIESAGNKWFKETQRQLQSRALYAIKPKDMNHGRSKRFIPFLAGAAGSFASSVVPPSVKQFTHKLFMPENSALNHLTLLKSVLPSSLKNFVELIPEVSKFFSSQRHACHVSETSTKAIRKNKVQRQMNPSWDRDTDPDDWDFLNFRDFAKNISRDAKSTESFISSFFVFSSDASNLAFNAFITSTYLNSITECRSDNVPLVFVPSNVLQKKLKSLETNLGNLYELLFSSEKVHEYYNHKFFSSVCVE